MFDSLDNDTSLANDVQEESIWTTQWEIVHKQLQAEYPRAEYEAWLSPLLLDGLHGGQLWLSGPTRFFCNFIEKNYAKQIRTLWLAHNPHLPEIKFCDHISYQTNRTSELGEQDSQNCMLSATQKTQTATIQTPRSSTATRNHTEDSPFPPRLSVCGRPEGRKALNPAFTFENFVTGKPNHMAYAAAERIAADPDSSYNPLFLYSGVGLGKTHLMHAIAWEIHQQQPQRQVRYVTAEEFLNLFVQALRERKQPEFKEMFRSVDVLMIDDLQFIAGKDNTQEEFFHCFNTLKEMKRQIVLSADRSPTDMENLEDRIRSRLSGGLVVNINPTDYELRFGILQSKLDRRRQILPDLIVPKLVLEFLAHRITSNVRELEGGLNRLVAHWEMSHTPITIQTAQETLADLLRVNRRILNVAEIKKQVAEYYNLRQADLDSARKTRPVARARQVAMYLARDLTDKSLNEIARHFGNRDHSTIHHGVNKIAALIKVDSEISEDIICLRGRLQK